jgi:hypothetical protein
VPNPPASAQQETGFGDANASHVLWLCNRLEGARNSKLICALPQFARATSWRGKELENWRYWLSVGVAYQVSRNGKLDFGYTLVSAKNADINNDQRAAGTGLVSVQYQHSF